MSDGTEHRRLVAEPAHPGAIRKLGAHIWRRETNEHYVEPAWVSQRLFEEEAFEGAVHDPACGFGRIVYAARCAGLVASGSDLVERSSDFPGNCDFMLCTDQFDNIVTNPPFDNARQFALHALKLVARKVAIVFPTARLNAAKWLNATPLARIWFLTPRPSMPPGHVIAAGEKPGGGKTDFVWLVFDRGHDGNSTFGWLHRERAPAS